MPPPEYSSPVLTGDSSPVGLESRALSAAVRIARTKVNQQQLRYFAAAICGLMAIFILSHWLRAVFNRVSPSSSNSVRRISRIVRNVLVRKVPGFTSSGHFVTVAAYVALNLALTLTNVQLTSANIANRCGWLLCSNFCLVIFLSLKNTPLAVLSAYSYERLNGLHQIAGYTTFGYLVLHAAMYSQYFIAAGRSKIFEEPSVIAGIVAGFGFLGVFLSGAVLRHIWYEAFYVSHIVCFLLALVGGAMHQPDITENGLLIMMLVVAGLWGADRLLRAARMLFRSFNNYAVVEPLPHGGTKITLAKRPYGAVGGKHCFVWIPRVRLFESHPFTIAGTEPMEFVVNAHDGFTRDLHQYAVANPGARLKASVDGPYGTFPDPMSAEFDKVVLIAGGSGATFTFGLATNMLERMGPNSTKNIVFIWAVKKHENLSWFADHLQTLKTHAHSPKVNVSLYVTTAASSSATTAASSEAELGRNGAAPGARNEGLERIISTTTTTTTTEPEKDAITTHHHHHRLDILNSNSDNSLRADKDAEKDPARVARRARRNSASTDDSSRHRGHEVRAGRPDTATLIREVVSSTPASGRVLIAACGPDGLMKVVRNTTASLIRGEGPGVELHCEQFGW